MIPSPLTKDKVRCYKDDHSKIKGFPIFFFYTTNDVLSAVLLLKQKLVSDDELYNHEIHYVKCLIDEVFPDLVSSKPVHPSLDGSAKENEAVLNEKTDKGGVQSSLAGDREHKHGTTITRVDVVDDIFENEESKPSEGDADRVRDLDSSSSGGDKHPTDCQCDSDECENCNRLTCDIIGCNNVVVKDRMICEEHKKSISSSGGDKTFYCKKCKKKTGLEWTSTKMPICIDCGNLR